ncbi:hypothetical protein [Bacteroides acidifaciens]|uniref:hypothetical protein n=1 Tax=Bacteroides acidifaciens TaxID=85831 RepID=UPI00046A7807|nr:hypothetical protein [Bacteroides acidifaciens]
MRGELFTAISKLSAGGGREIFRVLVFFLKFCMADPFLIYIFETFSMNRWDKDRIFFHKENYDFRF